MQIKLFVLLFNGISIFLGNLKPNQPFERNCRGTIKSTAGRIRVHTFLNGIYPKVNVIAPLEFELAYYGSRVKRFNHYTTISVR